MESMTIEDYMASRIEASLRSEPPSSDVYGFSLWVTYVDDDPRRPEVWFGSNDEAQVEASLERASDPVEARWNFAFWRQNPIEVIGGLDQHGATMFRSWFQHDLGQWFTDEDEVTDPEAADQVGALMEFHFFRKMADVVVHLHERGNVVGADGQRLPIIVHELEYDDEVANQNRRANPQDVLPAEFLHFCLDE